MRIVGVVVAAIAALVGIGAAASAQDRPPDVATETLHVRYQADDELFTPLLIDELERETLLTIEASGFDPDTTGTAVQCMEGASRSCQDTLRVRFDDRGTATFQYLITNDFENTDDGCRLGGRRCTIELRVGEETSVIDTVFLDAAPSLGQLRVSPRDDVLVGDTVTVTATGFPSGAELTLMLCAAPSTTGSRCGAPGPEVPVLIGPVGEAEVDMTLDAAEVGADRVACGRRVDCRIVAVSDQVGVAARPVRLSFADAPGADYAPVRLALGLSTAIALALFATHIVRSTDWAPPPESDSTAIDDAEFADLDLEADQFDELVSHHHTGLP